jgi:hypothetical protein
VSSFRHLKELLFFIFLINNITGVEQALLLNYLRDYIFKYDTLVLGEKDYGNFNTGTGTEYTEGRGASWIGRADRARNEASVRGIKSGKQT